MSDPTALNTQLSFWQQVVIAGLSGSILGAVTGFFSPALNWVVEKKRRKADARKDIIHSWRAAIEGASKPCNDPNSENYHVPFRIRFQKMTVYSQLKRHLNQDTIQEINAYLPDAENSISESELKELLLDNIAELESKWDLS